MNKKILLTGGSGLLSTNYISYTKNKDVILGFNKRILNLKKFQSILLNFENKKKLEEQIRNLDTKVVIHTAGITDVEKCEKYPNNCKKINYIYTKNLADVCEKLNLYLIFISTDHLFNGKKKFYAETSKCNPLNIYSKYKYFSEKYIINNNTNYLIIRTNFFGNGTAYRKSFSDFVLDNLDKKNEIRLAKDVFFSPISMKYLCEYMDKLIRKDSKGIYNISSNQRISKYNFGIKLAKIFKKDFSFIKEQEIKKNQNLKKPKNMSLLNLKLKKFLKIKIPKLEQQIIELKKEKSRQTLSKSIIPYGRHHIDKIDIRSVNKTLTSGYLTQGPAVEKLENDVKRWVGSKYAIAVSSCTAGLHLSALAAGIDKSSQAITSNLTFVSTPNAIEYCGGKTLIADIDNKNLNISFKSIKKLLKKNKKIKAVLPVHFGGLPVDIKRLKNLLPKNIMIIEDAAHAFGSRYKSGEMVGSCKYSDLCVFSLHPVKAIAAGEGGIITTNNQRLYRLLIRLRSHGINKLDDNYINYDASKTQGWNNSWYYEMQQLGFHYRITDIQCALASSQLKKLKKFVKKRQILSNRYDKSFSGKSFIKPAQYDPDNLSARHIYILRINFKKIKISRPEFMHYLATNGIGSQVHYIPITEQPYYLKKGFKTKNFPNMKKYYEECLTIPLFYDLSKSQQDYIVKKINEVL
jgi:perosamine synthetase